MKFNLESDSVCETCLPTQAGINEYLEEKDLPRLLALAYEYQITDAHLFPEDLKAILDDYYSAMNEIYEN